MPRHGGTGRQYLDLGLPAVCRRLDAARRQRAWTYRDLGRAAGIDETQAAKLLAPLSFGEPQLPTVVGLARALGLTLDGLFGIPAASSKIPEGVEAIGWIVARRGITRRQLAADAGLTPQTLSNIAAGRGRDFLSAVAIARAGGVSLDSLAAALLR